MSEDRGFGELSSSKLQWTWDIGFSGTIWSGQGEAAVDKATELKGASELAGKELRRD